VSGGAPAGRIRLLLLIGSVVLGLSAGVLLF
jgi:hypothetical protein